MRARSLSNLLLVAAVAACSSTVDRTFDEAEGAVVVASSSDLFAAGFDTWKQQLAARAREWRTLEPRTEVGRLPVGQLAIDYVYVPATQRTTNLIVMSSGIHGVEAPAGVVFQDLLLGECANLPANVDRTSTALLVVHVMNPFGAKYGRRFNENNVDLNRNAFDHESNRGASFAGLSIKNPEYEKVRSLVESRMNVADFLLAGATHGAAVLEKALSGQYEHPQGIYFGGRESQPEIVAVQTLLARYVPSFKNIALIDVHTGLGKHFAGVITTNSGINQIMTNPLEPSADDAVKQAFAREKATLDGMFPEAECKDVCVVQHAEADGGEDSHSFITTGDITQWLHARYPDKRIAGTILSVTAEISTAAPASVLEALVDENYCFHRRSSDECAKQYDDDVRTLRERFNPSDEGWRSRVLAAGRQMCGALGRFSRLP